jgi:hypothetical protein
MISEVYSILFPGGRSGSFDGYNEKRENYRFYVFLCVLCVLWSPLARAWSVRGLLINSLKRIRCYRVLGQHPVLSGDRTLS